MLVYEKAAGSAGGVFKGGPMKDRITDRPFGVTTDGAAVTEYTMTNAAGMTVRVLDYGATVRSIVVPDRAGRPVDVVLGYDDLAGYEAGNCYFGAVIGRIANRIAGASFPLDGRTVRLEPNEGPNHLHGTFARTVFEASAEPAPDGCGGGEALVLRHTSLPEEEGYPGTLSVEVRYTLTDDNALRIDYRAETDEPTPVNLTNHMYFNLNGEGDVLRHTLRLDADAFTETGPDNIPTGRVLPVEGTPMDFRVPKRIDCDIKWLTDAGVDDCRKKPYRPLELARGYDHSYVLKSGVKTERSCEALRLFAEAEGDRSGIRLEAFTDRPAVQLYTGNYVDADPAPCGKGGVRYPRYGGFCLETQEYPDAPNHPDFPPIVLRPGELWRSSTVYRFTVPAE